MANSTSTILSHTSTHVHNINSNNANNMDKLAQGKFF